MDEFPFNNRAGEGQGFLGVGDPGTLIMSPRTRRRQRGRGGSVLDNVTAAPSMTNATVITPDFLNQINPALADMFRSQINGPSPDEMVIQARGRRKVPLTFSPDVHMSSPTSRQQQRQRMVGQSQGSGRLLLPTRTSPRKRLTLNDSPPVRSPAAESYDEEEAPSTSNEYPDSSIFQTPSPDKAKRSPLSKRLKVENKQSPPSVLIKGLRQHQLVDLMNKMMERHPDFEEELSSMMPSPDMSAIEEKLVYLKKNVFKALPTTRLESKTDSLSYNRAATHLMALKKAVSEEGKQLLDAEQYAALMDYVLLAWSYVRATPVWDNPPHNNIRKHCFRILTNLCNQSLKNYKWEKDSLKEYIPKLKLYAKDHEELSGCIGTIEQIMNS